MSPFLVIQTVFFSELSLGLTINKNNLMKKSVHVAGLTSITVNECFLKGSNAIVTPCLSNHLTLSLPRSHLLILSTVCYTTDMM